MLRVSQSRFGKKRRAQDKLKSLCSGLNSTARPYRILEESVVIRLGVQGPPTECEGSGSVETYWRMIRVS